MRRLLVALGAAAALVIAAAPVAGAAPHRAPATITCAESDIQIQTQGIPHGWLDYQSSIDRIESVTNPHWKYCTAQPPPSGFTSLQIEIVGLNNMCWTYAGPQTGNPPLGYIHALTCADKASQRWTWDSNTLGFYNDYQGSTCFINAPRIGRIPYMDCVNQGLGSEQFLVYV